MIKSRVRLGGYQNKANPHRGDVIVSADDHGGIELHLRNASAAPNHCRNSSSCSCHESNHTRNACGCRLTFDEAEDVAAALRDMALVVRARSGVGFVEVA
ncbi:hypothetical protein [Antrihabitans sp. YC2-6]|uniref:hypothetical protein n=1 Tax=Antrihabitans sp. YC2-6 TaxID=2799498 RepID=UPI0018F53D06|nr:hypothetical protein [Antrihabitans sp. YC2-6]MBJ8344826.1 hypothetical protein [Antrihabitans sp. YC2-6]